MNEQQNPLGTQPVYKLLMRYGIPSVISMMVMAIYNIADQVFIGWGVGYLGNAATTVAFPLVTIMLAITLLIGNGSAAAISLELGKGNTEKARKLLGNAFVLLFGSAAVFTVLGIAFLEPVLKAMGATTEAMPYAMEYTGVILAGSIFAMVGPGLCYAIRADGSPRYSMVATLTGAVLNIILDPLFIFVFKMGVRGAAVATVISQAVNFGLVLYYFLRKARFVRLSVPTMRIERELAGRICALGSSSFVTQMAITIINIILNNSVTYYGEASVYGSNIPLSAMGVVMKINAILLNLVLGVTIGAQPIIGFNYGAGNYRRVKKTFQTEIAITTATSTLLCILFVTIPGFFIGLFGEASPMFNEFAALFMRTYLCCVFVIGVQIPSSNYFQAVGKPAFAMVLSMTRQLLFLAPLILIFPRIWGLEGILYAGPVADLLSFVVTGLFILREMRLLGKMVSAQKAG